MPYLQNSIKNIPYAIGRENNTCTLMLLNNLKEPKWIPVLCDKKWLDYAICLKQESEPQDGMTSSLVTEHITYCKRGLLQIDKNCYNFIWNLSPKYCYTLKNLEALSNNLKVVHHIISAMSPLFRIPAFILQDEVITIHRFFDRLIYKKGNRSIEKSETGGYLVHRLGRIYPHFGINMFHCTKGAYILHESVCDDIIDCPNDSSDEETCERKYILNNADSNISVTLLRANNKAITACGSNYYLTNTGLCNKFSSHQFSKNHSYTDDLNVLTCEKELNISDSFKSTPTSYNRPTNGEKFYHINSKHNTQEPSCEPKKISCLESYSSCFEITDICIYKLNKYNQLTPCSNGGHLQSCAQFECNLMFKCPNSYCIPWEYVCDGKWDCPFAHDESSNTICNNKEVCRNMYKCRFESIRCINIGNVCDNIFDCPKKDDEMFCDLKLVHCPLECTCLLYAITCIKTTTPIFRQRHVSRFLSVSITNSFIDYSKVYYFENAQFLLLHNNKISVICPVLHLKYLVVLQIQSNHLIDIHKNCFKESPLLKNINLDKNQIVFLKTYAFHNLEFLQILNLANNPLTNIPFKCFSNLIHLKILNITDFNKIYPDTFGNTWVKIIISNNFKISCVAPHRSLCTSHPPWYIS